MFIGSVQKLNYVKNKYTIFEWWRAVRNIVGNEIYVTHRFTSICIHEFVSFIFGEKNVFDAKQIRIPNGFLFSFKLLI